MQALLYEGPEQLVVDDVSDPVSEPGGVIVRVLACGICGTDLRIARGAHRAFPPGTRRVPGHEIVGEVIDVGRGTEGLEIGERVFIAPNLGCGVCAACRAQRVNLCAEAQAFGITIDGGFAQLMSIPPSAVTQGNLLALSSSIDPAAGSAIEPLACVLRGQRAVAVHEGDQVLVCGAGPIGLLHVMLAAAAGAEVIVSEPHPHRREQAARFGASLVIDPANGELPEHLIDHTDGRGADVVITAVPVRAVQEQALSLSAIGGRINLFGGLPRDDSVIALDSNLIHYRELVVTGTTANDVSDCRAALELLTDGRIALDRLITARFALQAAGDAFSAASGGEELKVVIEP